MSYYNRLDSDKWITKNGQVLNPLTSMTAEHIINVMNMLTKRAKENEQRLFMLRSTLGSEDFDKLMKVLDNMDVVTEIELKDTVLFKTLVLGLKVALNDKKRVEGLNRVKHPPFDSYNTYYPIDYHY